MWAAHDDERDPRYVSMCVAAMQSRPDAVLCCTDIFFLDQEGTTPDVPPHVAGIRPTGKTPLDRLRQVARACNWYDVYALARTSALSKTRRAVPTWGFDVVVTLELCLRGPVLFVPDFFLGSHVRRITGRALDVWMGECHVHAALTPADVEARRREYPDAEFLVHPECGCVTSTMYYASADGDVAAGRTRIVSTEQMMQRARTSPARRFVVATETGVLHRLRRENPDKQFHALAESAECRFMKLITLEKLRDCLRDLKPEVVVPPDVAARARRAIDRMLAIG